MTSQDEGQQGLSPERLTLIQAIAGRLDVQVATVARALDKDDYKLTYHAYAVLDSLSCSYSFYKYLLEISITTNSDEAHELMMSPSHILFILIETTLIVSFAFFATYFSSKKKSLNSTTTEASNDTKAKEQPGYEKAFQDFIISAWPYMRAFLKASKNAYKGVRSTLLAMSILAQTDLKYLICPIGLILGGISTINKMFLVYMLEERKTMMEHNTRVIKTIMNYIALGDTEAQAYNTAHYIGKDDEKSKFDCTNTQIMEQSTSMRVMAYLAVILNALIDSLYLYMGLLTLAALSPPLLLTVGVFCLFYSAACLITRIYEEYDYQKRLIITQTQIKLALTTRNLQTNYYQLIMGLYKHDKDEVTVKKLYEQLNDLIDAFVIQRDALRQKSHRGYFSAVLYGLRNGLYIYSALSSIIFLVGAILTLCSVSFPPALIIACASLGVIVIGLCISYSLYANYLYLQQEYKNNSSTDAAFTCIKSDIKKKLDATPEECAESKQEKAQNMIKINDFIQAIHNELHVTPTPNTKTAEWAEVWRSFFSGITKGQKFIDWSFNPLQEADAQGHYHDTPIMFVLGVGCGILYSVVLALRALAKGMGRDPVGANIQEENKSLTEENIIKITHSYGGAGFFSKPKSSENLVTKGIEYTSPPNSPKLPPVEENKPSPEIPA